MAESYIKPAQESYENSNRVIIIDVNYMIYDFIRHLYSDRIYPFFSRMTSIVYLVAFTP